MDNDKFIISGPICSSPEEALELWNNRKIVKTCPFCGSQIQDIGECSVCKSIFSKSNKFKRWLVVILMHLVLAMHQKNQ